MYKYMRIALCALIIFLAGIWTTGQAYGLETTEATEPTEATEATEAISSEERLARIAASRRLKISATPDDDAWITYIPLGDPEKMGVDHITYLDVTDVQIDIAGRSKKLETAILDGDISIPELICYAQMDALGGVCREIAWSRNGLAYYTYRYYEYDIVTCHDIYETPDGKQHKMSYFGVHKVGRQIFSDYEDESSPVGYYIDREDWGITLDVASVSPEGIVLTCDQQGGQQVGKLVTSYYFIYRGRTDGDRQYLCPDGPLVELEVQISENERTEISIDWQDALGSLPSGEYCLRLFIDDQYDREQLHPLIRKYHDGQAYWVDFTVS